jgi:hypothetical protein
MRKVLRARGRPATKAKTREYLYGDGVQSMVKTRLERATNRWEKTLARVERYGFPEYLKIVEAMTLALDGMKKTVQQLAKVPKDWKPAVGTVGVPLFEEGSFVKIKEDKRDKYTYLNDASQLFEVAAVEGSKIICNVPQGRETLRIPFPRNHVQLVSDS